MGVCSGMPKRLEGNLRDVRCNRRAKPHHITHLILRRLAGGTVVTGIHSCVELRGESSKGIDEIDGLLQVVRSNICVLSWRKFGSVLPLSDNSFSVTRAVVAVVHLDVSHFTPTGRTCTSVVPHAAYLALSLIPASARGDALWLAVLRWHCYF